MAKANSYDCAYLTTCIVPVYGNNGLVVNTHHAHFSIGPRVEGGIRDIIFDCHPVTWCNGLHIYRGQRVQLEDIVTLGFAIDTITDWTDEEVTILSGIFCPQSQALYDEEQRRHAEAEARWRLYEEAEEQRRLAEEQRLAAEAVALVWAEDESEQVGDDDESEQGYASD